MRGQLTRSKGNDSNKTRTDDAEYWHSRAERARKESRRHEQPAVRDHFVKIAAGYDELARRASETRSEADMAERPSQAASGQPEGTKASDEHNFRSDEVRVRDALEDDEVREVLRAIRGGST